MKPRLSGPVVMTFPRVWLELATCSTSGSADAGVVSKVVCNSCCLATLPSSSESLTSPPSARTSLQAAQTMLQNVTYLSQQSERQWTQNRMSRSRSSSSACEQCSQNGPWVAGRACRSGNGYQSSQLSSPSCSVAEGKHVSAPRRVAQAYARHREVQGWRGLARLAAHDGATGPVAARLRRTDWCRRYGRLSARRSLPGLCATHLQLQCWIVLSDVVTAPHALEPAGMLA